MKVTDSGDVPGITNQAAHAEAEWVVENMADDHFDNFPVVLMELVLLLL